MNDVGRPLAMILGGKYDKKVISVSDKFSKDDEALIKEFKQLKIPNDAKLQQVPDTTKEREIVYMTGPSGSGKSTYTRKYLEQWKKKFFVRKRTFFTKEIGEFSSSDKLCRKCFKAIKLMLKAKWNVSIVP